MTIVFLTRNATVDIVLWDDTRIVPSGSKLWAIQCTWSSYRNNRICYKGGEVYLDIRQVLYAAKKGIVPLQNPCHLKGSEAKWSNPQMLHFPSQT